MVIAAVKLKAPWIQLGASLERGQASKVAEKTQGKNCKCKPKLLLKVGQVSLGGRRKWGVERLRWRWRHSYGCTMNAHEKGEHPLTEVSRSGGQGPCVPYRERKSLLCRKVATSFRDLRWVKWNEPFVQNPWCLLVPCRLSTCRLWDSTSWKTASINASFSFSADRIKKSWRAWTGENVPEQKEQKVKKNLAGKILTGKPDTVRVSMKKIDVWFQKEQSTWICLVPERSECQIPLGLVYTGKLTDTAPRE